MESMTSPAALSSLDVALRRSASPAAAAATGSRSRYLDVDDSRAANDPLGHGEGDHLLATLAPALVASLRPLDAPARHGGDAFAVLMPETTSRSAELLPERLLAARAEAPASDGAPLSCRAGLLSCRMAPNEGRSRSPSAARVVASRRLQSRKSRSACAGRQARSFSSVLASI